MPGRAIPFSMSAVAITMLSSSLAAAAEPASDSTESEVSAVVGVCAVGGAWGIVWHPVVDGVPDADVVFRVLQGDDVDACLRRLIESDPVTLASVARLAEHASEKGVREAMRLVRARWDSYGLEDAIVEATTLRRRGPVIRSFLDRCRSVTLPVNTKETTQ